MASPQILPMYADIGLGRDAREVDRDEITLVVQLPAPGYDVPVTRVVRPAAAIAEPPPAISEDLLCRCREQTLVESLQVLIRRLVRAAA